MSAIPLPPLVGCVNKAGSLPSDRVMLSHVLKRYYGPLRLPVRPAAISFPYTRRLMFLNITASGLQHWTACLPQHAAPATPEDHPGRFRYPSPGASAFPERPPGRHLRLNLTRLRAGSLALRPDALPIGNLRPPVTRTPLP